MAVVITGNNTPTAGGVVYGDGTTYATTTAGTSGRPVVSGGAGAPTFRPYTLPAADGSANQILKTDGAGALSFATPSSGYTLGTPVATTSGTSVTFTGIPAGTKQIVINFVGVSTNGTNRYGIRLGDAGGIEATNYNGAGYSIVVTTIAGLTNTNMFFINSQVANQQLHGSVTLTLENSSSFTYCASGVLSEETNNESVFFVSGSKTLSQELDRVQILLDDSGTAFDAGEINIAYI